MIKKLVLAMALIPAVGFAAQSQQRVVTKDNSVINTYTCQQYTDNEMAQNKGFLTDNPVVQMEFEIEQTKFDYSIKENDLFKEALVMTIPEGGDLTGLSGNQFDMMFKKRDGAGKAYFIIYMSDPKNPEGWINRGVVIAGCDK